VECHPDWEHAIVSYQDDLFPQINLRILACFLDFLLGAELVVNENFSVLKYEIIAHQFFLSIDPTVHNVYSFFICDTECLHSVEDIPLLSDIFSVKHGRVVLSAHDMGTWLNLISRPLEKSSIELFIQEFDVFDTVKVQEARYSARADPIALIVADNLIIFANVHCFLQMLFDLIIWRKYFVLTLLQQQI